LTKEGLDVLIGIDMLGVQSSEGGSKESGRLGRQLVSALLAGDSAHRFVLYTHEGLPTERVPSSRKALRVSLPEGIDGPARLRATIQRVLDRNPDGLDWLVLLDPFDPGYGGLPPESPLNGVKVASVIAGVAPNRIDDRRLAPLRGHDAILAFSESTAAECRRRLPSARRRVQTLGLAVDDSWTGLDTTEPLSEATAERLGRLGIEGPYLFANLASGADRSNVGGILEAYHRLALEHQKGHQLVIAGELDHPWRALAYLHDHGCGEGLVLVGPVDEPTLRTLYGRCAAFVSPSFSEASPRSLVEAMRLGAAVVAGRAGSQPDVLADAGLLADPVDPAEIAGQVARILADVALKQDLREKALARSKQFEWGPVVEKFLGVLGGSDESIPPRPRLRFDRAHVARPRIAMFAASSTVDDRVARACGAFYDVDRYFEPGDPALVERFAIEAGGFDVRQFARNDAILDYHSVVYLLPDVFSLKAAFDRLDDRPGLVVLRDETSLGRIGLVADFEAEVACQRLRELFLTSSRLVVRSPRDLDAIRSAFPENAERVVAIPDLGDPGAGWRSLIEDCAAGLPGRTDSGFGWPTSPHSPRVADALNSESRVNRP
jgi:glycosyltransferase involved in cell wall biosynthesis